MRRTSSCTPTSSGAPGTIGDRKKTADGAGSSAGALEASPSGIWAAATSMQARGLPTTWAEMLLRLLEQHHFHY